MKNQDELNESNISVSNSELLELSVISEITLEKVEDLIDQEYLSNEVLKEIPIVKTITSVYKVTKRIQENLLGKKIIAFLEPLKNVSSEARKKMAKEMGKDSKFHTKVGETILMLLDKHEDIIKASYLGQSFKAYLDDRIKYVEFINIASAIDRTSSFDLISLKMNYNDLSLFEEDLLQRLYSAGWVNINYNVLTKSVEVPVVSPIFQKNLLGVMFYGILNMQENQYA